MARCVLSEAIEKQGLGGQEGNTKLSHETTSSSWTELTWNGGKK